MKRLSLLFVIAACGGSSKPAPVTAPSEALTAPAGSDAPVAETAPPNDVVAQAELAEQYDLGKRVYVDKKCASCHGDHGEGNPKNPAVIGDAAFPEQPHAGAKLRTMPFHTAGDVLAFVKAKMPLKAPGTLTDDEAAAVTSWMLSESKVAIAQKLTAANAAAINLR